MMDDAEPVSPSWEDSCKFELKGRMIEPITEKGMKVRRNNHGEMVPKKNIKTPEMVQNAKQTVASTFLLLFIKNLT